METVSTSETSANFYETIQSKIPEDSHLHTRRREYLKSNQVLARTIAPCFAQRAYEYVNLTILIAFGEE
jgi:hypothetical protein